VIKADQNKGIQNTALQQLNFIFLFFFFLLFLSVKGIDIFHKWKAAIAFFFFYFTERPFCLFQQNWSTLVCKNVTFSPRANSWKFTKIYDKKQSFNFHKYAPGENVTFLQRGMYHPPQQMSIFLTK